MIDELITNQPNSEMTPDVIGQALISRIGNPVTKRVRNDLGFMRDAGNIWLTPETVYEAFMFIDEKFRNIVLRNLLNGEKLDAIATELGVSITTVRNIINEVIEAIQSRFMFDDLDYLKRRNDYLNKFESKRLSIQESTELIQFFLEELLVEEKITQGLYEKLSKYYLEPYSKRKLNAFSLNAEEFSLLYEALVNKVSEENYAKFYAFVKATYMLPKIKADKIVSMGFSIDKVVLAAEAKLLARWPELFNEEGLES